MRFSTVAILFGAVASASANTIWARQNLPGEYPNVALVSYFSNESIQRVLPHVPPPLTSVVAR